MTDDPEVMPLVVPAIVQTTGESIPTMSASVSGVPWQTRCFGCDDLIVLNEGGTLDGVWTVRSSAPDAARCPATPGGTGRHRPRPAPPKPEPPVDPLAWLPRVLDEVGARLMARLHQQNAAVADGSLAHREPLVMLMFLAVEDARALYVLHQPRLETWATGKVWVCSHCLEGHFDAEPVEWPCETMTRQAHFWTYFRVPAVVDNPPSS